MEKLRVQVYYAVKANPVPAIVKTLYKLGSSCDVASLAEFFLVHENIKELPATERQEFIWAKIIYANPIKAIETLKELDRYKPLVTYDNPEEVNKIRRYAPYDQSVQPFAELATMLRLEFDHLFPESVDLAAEPGRYLVATAATVVASVIGKTQQGEKPSYYLDDGVYQTFSGIVFDRCKYRIKAFKSGHTRISAVYGPTCDSLDTISLSEDLPELNIEDRVYAENIGAYSHATAIHFSGFSPAKVLHINE